MPIPILMPALSPTMEDGKLARWFVKEGDTVVTGDVIAEIETDKATMEVEAIEDGTVGRILVAEGAEEVAVNSPIALMLEDGEDVSNLDALETDVVVTARVDAAVDVNSAAIIQQSGTEDASARERIIGKNRRAFEQRST